jgi:hypothetical protein
MFLSEGKRAHDHESHQDKSGYDVLHHGDHSRELAHYVIGDRGRSRQRAERPIEIGRPME